MREKKLLIATTASAALAFLIVIYLLTTVGPADMPVDTTQTATTTTEVVVVNKCTYASDAETLTQANQRNDLELCDCMESDEYRDICYTSVKDTGFYEQAIKYLDDQYCGYITFDLQKDACFSVVEGAVEQLSETNPQRLAALQALSHSEDTITSAEKLVQNGSTEVNDYVLLALAYAEKGLKEQEMGGDQTPYVNKALDTIEKGKVIDSNSSELYRAEGYAYEIMPDYEKSLEAYNRAIELDANNIRAYAGRGHLKRLQGDLPGAIEDLNTAAEMDVDNNNIFIYSNLCTLELMRSNLVEAEKNCEIVVGWKNTDTISRSDAYQNLATIAMRKGDFTKAETYFMQAQVLMPNDANLYVSLSRLDIVMEDYVKAETDARKAIELSTQKASAYLALSQALYMQERFEESISEAETGVGFVDKDVSLLMSSKFDVKKQLYYMIANNYRQMGDTEKQAEYEGMAENVKIYE